jgi:hypothetical protein
MEQVTDQGAVNYRLVRARTLHEYAAGELTRSEVCDAQPELQRNAEHCGVATGETCPICTDSELVHVTYVFGSRLPAHGRCVTTLAEMERLRAKKLSYTGYLVEVCRQCGWNHMTRSYPVGGVA